MRLVSSIVQRLFGILLGIVSVFKRMMCFLNIKRGRKNSGTLLPMHADLTTTVQQAVPSNQEVELESWDNWVEGSSTNPAGFPTPATNAPSQAALRRPAYMNKPVLLSNKPEPEPEPDIDFFEDMKPKIKKAAKILVKPREELSQSEAISSRLAMTSDVHLAPIEAGMDNGGMEGWQEGGGSSGDGWGEEAMEDLSWEAESAIRDKKRQERERRLQEHQQRKVDKDMMRSSGGGGGGGGGIMGGVAGQGQFSAVKLS